MLFVSLTHRADCILPAPKYPSLIEVDPALHLLCMIRSTICDKVVVLARGLGRRMRHSDSSAKVDAAQSEVADAGIKALIPIGRPFLDYSLSSLAAAGFRQICLVIGPEHDRVRSYYSNLPIKRFQLAFAIQSEPLGTANAVVAAEEFVGDEPFVVINSDNYYPEQVLSALRCLDEPGTVLFQQDALVRNSNIPAERVQTYAYCAIDSDGYLVGIREKPEKSDPNALVSMNCWRFDSHIFPFCKSIPKSVRNEYELPTAVRSAVKGGIRFKVVRSVEGVLDLSQRSDISAVAERLKNSEVEL